MKSSRVLLICPGLEHSWTVAWILTRLGHQVHVSRCGRDGMKKAETCQFDLVVLVDSLTDIPAWDLFYRLDDQTRHRTLVLTREPDPFVLWRKHYPEAREVLEVPERPEGLAAVICEVLIRRGSHHNMFSTEIQHH